MRLYSAGASPFVRKVAVCAAELGLTDKINFVTSATTPVNPNPELKVNNPVSKIPALILDDGTAIYDSRVICEYLDSQSDAASLFPASGPARWRALRIQALADGLMDAAVLARYEGALRPADKQWPDWIDGQMYKVDGALDGLEEDAKGFGETVDIASIAAACACGYLDFRYTDKDWRSGHPTLAAWYEGFKSRASMQSTEPSG